MVGQVRRTPPGRGQGSAPGAGPGPGRLRLRLRQRPGTGAGGEAGRQAGAVRCRRPAAPGGCPAVRTVRRCTVPAESPGQGRCPGESARPVRGGWCRVSAGPAGEVQAVCENSRFSFRHRCIR